MTQEAGTKETNDWEGVFDKFSAKSTSSARRSQMTKSSRVEIHHRIALPHEFVLGW